jgi:hypothetical protein
MNNGARVLMGVAGGIAGALSMDAISILWSYAGRGEPDAAESSLLQHGGRPEVEKAKEEQKSSGDPEAVATTKIAKWIAEPVLGRSLSRDERHRGGQIVHYTYGALMGTVYVLSVRRFPAIRSGWGTLFGFSSWLGGVVIGMPVLGLMNPPHKYSMAQHSFSLLTHLSYGAVLESTRALLDSDPNGNGSN